MSAASVCVPFAPHGVAGERPGMMRLHAAKSCSSSVSLEFSWRARAGGGGGGRERASERASERDIRVSWRGRDSENDIERDSARPALRSVGSPIEPIKTCGLPLRSWPFSF
jgi:hypothetical protein